MKKLNENETKVLRTICEGCDEIDGWGFHRPSMLMVDVMREFDGVENKGQVVGGYIRDLMDKNLIEFNAIDDEVWVSPDVYERYC